LSVCTYTYAPLSFILQIGRSRDFLHDWVAEQTMHFIW